MCAQQRPRKRRTWLRILLAVTVVLLLGAAGLAYWAWKYGEDWLERTARERIAEAIDKASVNGYHFTMQGLETNARTGRMSLTGVDLDFAPELLDSLRSGAFRYLFAAKARHIELRGLSYWRLLWKGEFRVDALVLMEPSLSYLLGGQRVGLADPFTRFEGNAGALSLLFADTVVLRGGVATVEDLGERLPRLEMNGLDLEGRSVRITMGQLRGGVRLVLDGAELQLDSLSTQLPDGDRFSIGEVRISRSARSGTVRNITLQAQAVDTLAADLERKALVNVQVDSMLLSGLDLDGLITEQALRIEHMTLHGAQVQVELDKTWPMGEEHAQPLPPAALLALPFAVRVDTLSVVDGGTLYRERDGSTKRWGTVPLQGVQARFLNVANEHDKRSVRVPLTAHFSATLFHDAALEGTYSAALDGSDHFELNATVTGLPMRNLNNTTRPLLRVQVQGGMLHGLHLRMEGNARRAKGNMAVHYSDLRFRVEPGTPRELRHSMFGSVLETMLTEAYGGGLTADRERSYSVEHVPSASLITYIWHATREGLARNLAPEAWERMRGMLRTDGEQRREQREMRRQRRQERQERR